jgi:hypothetical protein
MVVYAVFGTSRQLIVNPDAATCAMVAAIVAPLAAGDPGALHQPRRVARGIDRAGVYHRRVPAPRIPRGLSRQAGARRFHERDSDQHRPRADRQGSVLPQVRRMLERSGALERLGADAVFPALRAAVEACVPGAGRAAALQNGSLSSVRGE